MSSTFIEFRECETCRAKPGSPVLCNGCRHNRAVIEEMRRVLQKISTAAKEALDD